METKILSGQLYAEMLKQGSLTLKANKSIVNDLNVFPIPDGDTGDNMYMTISFGADLALKETSGDLGKVAHAAADGMLRGARGNSGVILSRIFAGISKGLEGCTEADVRKMGEAFTEGVRQSYSAVTTPVEGTILTVFKDSTNAANAKITDDSTLETYFEDFTKELKESLERTPDLLDVLKEAGVVDSGGAGLLYIADGMKNRVNGIIKYEDNGEEDTAPKPQAVNFDLFGPDSELEFGYCTEFLLRLQNAKTDIENFDIEGLIKYLNDIGDSVVAFRDGSIVKVHVHTFTPGIVLEHCRQYGEFLTIKIENMTLQHHNTTVQNRYNGDEAERNEQVGDDVDTSFFKKEIRKKYGIVSVAAGEGVKSMFSEIGVDAVVDGGQSMNPSAQDLVDAFKKVNADTIFVLPNNKNIILTAKQAAALYTGSEVRVLPTKTIGDGYAAVSMMDLSLDTADEVEQSATDSMEGVVTGLVSTATRNTEKDGIKVKAGDYLGFADDTIYYSGDSKIEALLTLAEKLDADDKAVLLLIRGEGASEEENDEVMEALSGILHSVEIIPIEGKQPIYDFMMVLE